MIRRRFYQQEKEMFDRNNYLTFEPLTDNFTFAFSRELEYNVNGDGWKILAENEEIPYIMIGDFVSLRANLLPIAGEGIGYFVYKDGTRCNLSGNCMSLIFKDEAKSNRSLIGYGFAFYRLFRDFYGIKGVSNDFLPATKMSVSCYAQMFYGCTSLVNAPELPATTLASSCYDDMFYGCRNLNYIKMLATDISAPSCLSDWVYGVSPTGTFVKSKDATWDVVGDSGVPTGWTVITDEQESGGSITFSVEDNDGLITEYVIPNQMTWEEFINSEYNVDLRSEMTGEYYKEFRTNTDDGVKYYVQYRHNIKYPEDEHMIHKGDWEYVYIDEYIEPIQYTNM